MSYKFGIGSLVRIPQGAKSINAGLEFVIVGHRAQQYRVLVIDQRKRETRYATYNVAWMDKNGVQVLGCYTPEHLKWGVVDAPQSDTGEFYCFAKHPTARLPKVKHGSFEEAKSEAIRLSQQLQCHVEVLRVVGTAKAERVITVEVSFDENQ